MTPGQTVGRHGLLGSRASGAALGPTTTWVPPSGRLIVDYSGADLIRHFLVDSKVVSLSFKYGLGNEAGEWLAELRRWHYPFTSDEVQQIIEWSRSNEAGFSMLYKWGIYVAARLWINGGYYETGSTLIALPFFSRVKKINLGKMVNLTSI